MGENLEAIEAFIKENHEILEFMKDIDDRVIHSLLSMKVSMTIDLNGVEAAQMFTDFIRKVLECESCFERSDPVAEAAVRTIQSRDHERALQSQGPVPTPPCIGTLGALWCPEEDVSLPRSVRMLRRREYERTLRRSEDVRTIQWPVDVSKLRREFIFTIVSRCESAFYRGGNDTREERTLIRAFKMFNEELMGADAQEQGLPRPIFGLSEDLLMAMLVSAAHGVSISSRPRPHFARELSQVLSIVCNNAIDDKCVARETYETIERALSGAESVVPIRAFFLDRDGKPFFTFDSMRRVRDRELCDILRERLCFARNLSS